ncbi:hypothetical protein TUSST3_72440 [Streptomyces sp. TUS-ST3]|nr:hypothetical protein TUSST3_72440 [Streptomyces sp. TUS-ST3]
MNSGAAPGGPAPMASTMPPIPGPRHGAVRPIRGGASCTHGGLPAPVAVLSYPSAVPTGARELEEEDRAEASWVGWLRRVSTAVCRGPDGRTGVRVLVHRWPEGMFRGP